MSTGRQEVESAGGWEKGGAVGQSTESRVLISLQGWSAYAFGLTKRKETYLPLGLWLDHTSTTFGSEG